MKNKVKTLPQEAKPIPSLPSYFATPEGSIYRISKVQVTLIGVEKNLIL